MNLNLKVGETTNNILSEAIKRRNLKMISDAISEENIPLDSLNSKQLQSLLRLSVKLNNVPVFNKLVCEKISPFYASSLLWTAVASGHTEIAMLMLNHGADVNALHGRYHKCAFYYTLKRKCEILVKELFKRGAHIRYPLLQKIYKSDQTTIVPYVLYNDALNIFVDAEIKHIRLVSLLWDLSRLYGGTEILEQFEKVLALGVTADELNKCPRMFVNLMRI